MEELLAKGAIEALSGSTCFHLSLFVVPKHTCG